MIASDGVQPVPEYLSVSLVCRQPGKFGELRSELTASCHKSSFGLPFIDPVIDFMNLKSTYCGKKLLMYPKDVISLVDEIKMTACEQSSYQQEDKQKLFPLEPEFVLFKVRLCHTMPGVGNSNVQNFILYARSFIPGFLCMFV